MSELTSKSTLERHKLGTLPADFWAALLHFVSLREVLLLSETGDKRVYQHIKNGLKRLYLKREQVIPRRISPNFASSWNGLYELKLGDVDSKSNDCFYYIRANLLIATNLPLWDVKVLVDFTSLKSLSIGFHIDLASLSLLNSPLEYLELRVSATGLHRLILPSSCSQTLHTLHVYPDSSNSHYELLNLPWLSTLPHSLCHLETKGFFIHPSLLSNLPASCTRLSFSTLTDGFSYRQLAHLPHTIHHLFMVIYTPNKGMVLDPLNIILSNLPRNIRFFASLGTPLEEFFSNETSDIILQHLPSLPFSTALRHPAISYPLSMKPGPLR